jgi:hypothetical protein
MKPICSVVDTCGEEDQLSHERTAEQLAKEIETSLEITSGSSASGSWDCIWTLPARITRWD